MSIAVNGVQEKRKSPMFPLLAGAAGAATGGYVVGDPLNSKYILAKDTFKLSDKAQAALNKTNSSTYDDILKAAKSANTDAVSARVEKIMKGASEIDAKEYIKNFANMEKAAEANKLKTEALTNAVKDAVDEPAKKAAQSLLDTHNAKIARNNAKMASNKALLDSVNKEGKVSKEAVTNYVQDGLKSKAATQIDDVLKGVKDKLPKIFSNKKALIGAAIGLTAGWVMTRLFSKKEA